MSTEPAPYTGSSSDPTATPAAAAGASPAADGPPQPAFPTVYAPLPATWHSPALLIGIIVVAVIGAVLTTIGGQGFPYNAPVEQLYAFGLTIDLAAVAVTLGVLTVVEFRRRSDADRRALPVNGNRSVLAVIAVAFSGLVLVAWAMFGGLVELVELLSGQRTRYMEHTGALFLLGAPWVLGIVFGAWGFRPGGGHRTTNLLALIAVGIGVLLIIPSTAAALVYGAGLSD